MKTFFTVTSCMVAITTFMDFTRSYITDYLQDEKSLTIFEDLMVQGQGQGQLDLRFEHKTKTRTCKSRTRTFLEDNNAAYT